LPRGMAFGSMRKISIESTGTCPIRPYSKSTIKLVSIARFNGAAFNFAIASHLISVYIFCGIRIIAIYVARSFRTVEMFYTVF
jgi:hypothetical protein